MALFYPLLFLSVNSSLSSLPSLAYFHGVFKNNEKQVRSKYITLHDAYKYVKKLCLSVRWYYLFFDISVHQNTCINNYIINSQKTDYLDIISSQQSNSLDIISSQESNSLVKLMNNGCFSLLQLLLLMLTCDVVDLPGRKPFWLYLRWGSILGRNIIMLTTFVTNDAKLIPL